MSDQDNAVLEAKESFVTDINGDIYHVVAGATRLRADHVLNKRYPQHFRPIEEGLTYGLEDASAAPGEVRNRQVGGSQASQPGSSDPPEPPAASTEVSSGQGASRTSSGKPKTTAK